MALPILRTSDRVRLVYTGDPSIRGNTKPADFVWRPATSDDAAKGATVAVIRPLSATEHKQASISGNGHGEPYLHALVLAGLVAVDGDVRPIAEIVETMPAVPLLSLAQAIDKLSSETADPFGQRSSG